MTEIVFETEPKADTRTAVIDALVAYNIEQTGGKFGAPQHFAFSLRDPETGAATGGLIGRISFAWMYIELLAVPEALRGKGLGEGLMQRAEAFAREQGCLGIWVDSYTFQAPGFYNRLGFSEFGAIANYPPGNSRHFLHKHLS